MAVTLGAITFDETYTTVEERLEEVGGRDERRIVISGVVPDESTVAAIEDRIDGIVEAASVVDYTSALSLREGRRLWVRRERFERSIDGSKLVGSYALRLIAKDPEEESTEEQSIAWNVAASGATTALATNGNADTAPRITLVATGSIINPTISDGVRAIGYSGVVADGETLVIDGTNGIATLEGSDVTPYTTGLFPRVSPGGTTFTYSDDLSSAHTAAMTVAYRDRWW